MNKNQSSFYILIFIFPLDPTFYIPTCSSSFLPFNWKYFIKHYETHLVLFIIFSKQRIYFLFFCQAIDAAKAPARAAVILDGLGFIGDMQVYSTLVQQGLQGIQYRSSRGHRAHAVIQYSSAVGVKGYTVQQYSRPQGHRGHAGYWYMVHSTPVTRSFNCLGSYYKNVYLLKNY